MVELNGVRYHTTSQAADLVGVHRKVIWNAIKHGRLPALAMGNGAHLVAEEDILAYRDQYKAEGVNATELAERFGKSRQGVHNALRRLGVDPIGHNLQRFGHMVNIYDPDQAVEALKSIGWEE